MNSKKKNARIAGLMYLLMGITGAFGIMYVPSNIMVAGNATATANNIMDSELLFRLSMISNLISQTIFVFLVLSLNRLLKGVNPKHARLMVTLVTISVPIAFLNILNLVAAQILVSGADYLTIFDENQLNSIMMVFLNLYEHGIFIVGIFWGLWLYPLGLLVIKSKFIPKIIGIFLIIGCFAYLTDSFTSLLFPLYKEIIFPILIVPLAIGEFSIIFWLLIKGVKTQQSHIKKGDNNV
ncbi:hypothetical protein BST83_18755 [Polaribacter filamentus]|uniref:DUF4386 domain-containing protein n=1 Tax=Polaribacter filamentus TaxID=53483 RepID=A0A2S7KL48_9FLAO|nr:DUF4386 domain-containing protein [Polaribacter filamentus]PQB03338.1 hypothetical protein BST83_18755 [Polaribacter filamentus]